MVGLYLHIPFCQAICSYCNFNRGLFDETLKARYVAALTREIKATGDGRPADTIFFGGGTPSLLDPADVSRLVEACRDAYAVTPEAEVTLETNPETATTARFEAFREAGVNRLSIGVQSFNDDELTRLGRIHTAVRAAEAIGAARRAGVTNVSLDLMLWLPGQTVESWRRTVGRAIALGPDHLSLYLLELYPNAPLKEAMARATLSDPAWAQTADDQAADMYLEAFERLDAAGYLQYEISNTSRRGYESRHNLKYWQSGEWLGFGCGAHSTADGRRWRNVAATTEYVRAVEAGRPSRCDEHSLSPAGRIEEALFTGLRLTAGIDRQPFHARFGIDPWARYGSALAPAREAGLLWTDAERFGLSRRGMLVANEILAVFV